MMRLLPTSRRPITCLAALLAAALATWGVAAQDKSADKPAAKSGKSDKPAKSDFPPYDQVTKGYEKVVSTADGKSPLYTLWVDKKEGEMLAELPADYAKKKYFIALTVASGERFAGLQAGELYVYWKRYDKNLALIEKQLDTRSTGDKESKSSVKRLFTDRVIADVPIVGMSPKGGPIIDADYLFVFQAHKFFGFTPRGEERIRMVKLRAIKTAKAFPKNVEIGYEVPLSGGQLKTLHYSVSEIPDDTGYKPRVADDRVGYFTTAYNDLGKYKRDETRTRYINRWHLEKADPKINLSPPKQPIVFYIEHTTPIRYRRFVREGILYWNRAFEKVGLVNAVEVYQQDATTGAHMDKDPEDVRYNFVRWLNNNVGTAIGPSRVHPLTGEILDADIILTDGWIRAFDQQFNDLLPDLAMEGFSPETMTWLDRNPRWDPRYLMAPTHERGRILQERARQTLGVGAGLPRPYDTARPREPGDAEFDAIVGRNLRANGFCMAARGKALDLTLLRMTNELLFAEEEKKDEKKKDEKKKDDKDENKIDGIPAEFIGPLLADLVAHEVGHTLGLRHNFAASSLYTLAEINSKEVKGKKPFAGSVMDYLPVNINMKDGEVQGDYAMIAVGPYDEWAIEYGYTFEKDLKPILAKASEPGHLFATDQDTAGPDPLARRYDFSANPLDYAKNQGKLARHHRQRLVEKFVKEGDSWSKARRGYELTLALQTRSLSMMANWLGGAHVRREHKGDNGKQPPIQAVPPAVQREALKWVIENAFRDEAFGLTPQLLRHMKHNSLVSDESFSYGRFEEGTYPIHDRVMGVQSSVLTMLMNPTTLRRIYDNELLVPADQDAFTMPEMLETLSAAVWTEIAQKPAGKFTARKPMISSLRRNLQRTCVERLIDLAMVGSGSGAAAKPISDLAMAQLRSLGAKVATALKDADGLDPYSKAHLEDVQLRITKALESQYIFNARDIGGGGFSSTLYLQAHALCSQPGCRRCGQPEPSLSWSVPRTGR